MNKRTKRGRGHPPFEPTRQERTFVAAMSGVRMSADQICAVIGAARNGVGDDLSGKPISKSTLFKHFRNEMRHGRSLLKAKIMGKYYAALDEGREWAIAMGMRNLHAFDIGRGGFSADPAALTDGVPQIGAEVVFIVPGYGASEVELEPEQRPIPNQRLLPPPPPRTDTGYGVVEDRDPPARPSKPGDWMG